MAMTIAMASGKVFVSISLFPLILLLEYSVRINRIFYYYWCGHTLELAATWRNRGVTITPVALPKSSSVKNLALPLMNTTGVKSHSVLLHVLVIFHMDLLVLFC
jgi:hypothetical protein